MKSFRWRRFADPEFLGSMEPGHLKALLHPFADFFQREGVDVSASKLDYNGLVKVFTQPGTVPPVDLVTMLNYIDEIAIEAYHDKLATAWEQYGVGAGDDLSTADYAALLWVADPAIIERLYAEQVLVRQTSFEIYVTRTRAIPQPAKVTTTLVKQMEDAIQSQFDKLGKGGVRVFEFREGNDLCFVIRHGGTYERGLKEVNAEPKAFAHRRMKHDVMIYNPESGELAVRGDGVRATRIYAEVAGQFLFGNDMLFAPADAPGKYTLMPFLKDGAAVLDCSKSRVIKSAHLVEIAWRYGGSWRHTARHAATDVFASLASIGDRIPYGVKPLHAVISYSTSASLRPHRLRLRPPNTISYDRESDAEFIEPWLEAIGLINDRFTASGLSRASFWTSFERRHDLTGTRDDWQSAFGPSFVQLDPLLVGTNRESETATMGDESNGDWRVVDHDGRGARVAVAEDPELPAVRMAPETQTDVLGLEISKLAERLAGLLGITPEYEPIRDLPGAWRIGVDQPAAAFRSPVVLLKPSDTSDLRRLVDGLAARGLTACIALAPTRRTLAGDLVREAETKSVIFGVLDEMLEPDPTGWFNTNHEWPELVTRLRKITVPEQKNPPIFFMTPPDATWSDVVIQFLDAGGERVSVRVKEVRGVFTYQEMGMADGRGKTPNKQWELLKALLEERHGVLTWDSRQADRKVKVHKEKLSKTLRAFFGLEDDPIPYDEAEKGWRWKFTLRPHDWVGV